MASSINVTSQSIASHDVPQDFGTIYDISDELKKLLQHVVNDVVAHLGCVGAMVATVEADNSMPVRAYATNVAPELLHHLESKLGVTFVGPKSVAYLDNKKFKDNLGVRAVRKSHDHSRIVTSTSLYDLFRPVVSKPLSDLAQRLVGIKQVIAVPFFLEDEVVGNLFAAAQREFSVQDIDFLQAFAKQAAIGIKSQRHLTETQALERVILALQTHITDETQVLQTVVDAVVQRLGYVGAMVATLEADNSLPVRAYATSIAPKLFRQLENNLGLTPISPQARAYLDDERYKDNLCVRAVKGINGQPAKFVTSDSLYDLFRPVVPQILSISAQRLTGIKQVIAVPFFLEDEVVGNLFVATRRPRFAERERELLATFGQQAAVGIRNARLYRRAEEQRKIAQVFGKMAFSAATNVHTLRNHIGGFRTFLSLVKMLPTLPPETQEDLLKSGDNIMNDLNDAAEILDKLHEPWRKRFDVPTPINECLDQAIRKTFLKESLDFTSNPIISQDSLTIHREYDDHLAPLQTSPDMLTESFRIIIKNGVEALLEHGGDTLWITSRARNKESAEIIIRDNGVGISSQNLSKIFELGWSSKDGRGMGFGLFWTKDYIEGVGGKIEVESQLRRGTTFRITLPLGNSLEEKS